MVRKSLKRLTSFCNYFDPSHVRKDLSDRLKTPATFGMQPTAGETVSMVHQPTQSVAGIVFDHYCDINC